MTRTAFIAVTLSIALTTPLCAQSPTLLDNLLSANNATQRQDLRAMAQCIVQRQGDLIDRIIVNQNTDLLTQSVNKLSDAKCARARFFRNSQFSLTPWYFTLLAELLFAERFGKATLPDLSAAPPLEYQALAETEVERKLPPDMQAAAAAMRWQVTVDRSAECAARREGAAIQRLVATRPDSSEESDAVRAIVEHASECGLHAVAPIPPDFVLRSALAEAAYRLTVATKALGGAS